MDAHGGFMRLRTALEARVPGHSRAVHAVLLGLVAREHVWLEGPPGCGKTRLAESAARACARSVVLSLHRDSRPDTFWGERTWTRTPGPAGERIAIEIEPGGLATAELAVLDDLERAPSGARGPLLAALSRRCHGDVRLDLECAIATGLPPGVARGVDPLQSGELDGFALQVRMPGLLASADFAGARRVLAAPDAPVPELHAGLRRTARAEAAALPIGSELRDAFASRLAAFRASALADPGALLSDRSFGPVALRVVRAHAWLRGGREVELQDLDALDAMLLRRLPAAVAREAGDASEVAAGATVAGAGIGPGSGGEAPRSPRPGEGRVLPAVELPRATPGPHIVRAEVAALLEALEGHLGRGHDRPRDDPGGMPRSWRPLRSLADLPDADPVEAWAWASARQVEVPRVARLARRKRGGAVAVLRDVSASMEGRFGRWAGDVVVALADLARRQRLRVGYVEFNHDAEPFVARGRFFHRRYDALAELGARRRCEGRTSYAAPLAAALDQLARVPDRDRHVVLLTDGVPVVGDPEVLRERAAARRLGVRVHTVFIGTGPVPAVLDALSLETGGLRFRARPRAGGRIDIGVAA